jgi:AcrR family transcriptional regulator
MALPKLVYEDEETMPVATMNKHALKTRDTREQLLRAAERVFVRDGFEKADLVAIAAEAGRTRGAIYAQFSSKEDVFLALIQEKTRIYRAQVEQVVSSSASAEENLRAYRSFVLQSIDDPAWSLLLLEFKLFATRHPESKEQLLQFYEEVFSKDQEKKIIGLIGSSTGKGAISRSIAVQALQPLLAALAIESSFAPALLSRETQKKVAMRIFDSLLLPESK